MNDNFTNSHNIEFSDFPNDIESFADILADWERFYSDDFVEQEKITLREFLSEN
jgi:hypothetical protein